MLSRLALVLFTFFSIAIKAQNYSCFPLSTTESYFITNKGYVVARALDSVKVEGNDTILFNFKTARRSNDGAWRPYYPSWLGNKIIIKPGGRTLFVNRNNEPLEIKSQAKPGDSWIFFNADGISYSAIVESLSTSTFLGITDSIKTIKLISDKGVYNDKRIKLSKNHGLISFPQIYNFPDSTYNSDWFKNDGGWINIIGSTNIASSRVNLTSKEIFDLNIGDVHREHGEEDSGSTFSSSPYRSNTNTIFTIINRADSINQIKYLIETCSNYTLYDMQHQNGYTTYEQDTISSIYKTNSVSAWIDGDEDVSKGLDQIPEKSVVKDNKIELVSMFYDKGVYNKNISPLPWQVLSDGSMQGAFDFYIPFFNYMEGLGGGYYNSHSGFNLEGYSSNELTYYKIRGKEYGISKTCSEILSVEPLESNFKFLIYPMPAQEFIIIESSVTVNDVTIFNCLGQTVHYSKTNEMRSEIKLNNIKSGIYIVSAHLSNGTVKRQKITIE